MLEKNVTIEERELGATPFSPAELDKLIGKRDYREFLNPRNELFRERKMKERPPSRPEALKLMSDNPNLIRRPILIVGNEVRLGFDEKAWKELLS
ncbi:MAG: hypothetical protein HY698_16185 [Deltaproteobacteria bacterium]|nr:hypothetical protein [Deltaproteobacteria bacterium]